MLSTSIRPPTVEELKKQTMADVAVAAGLADRLRDSMGQILHIDPYTVSDPFDDKAEYAYSLIVDREDPNRVVAMLAAKKDSLPQLPWSAMLGERLAKLSIAKDEAEKIKQWLMPKATNNFYPYRRGGKVVGFVMFAFQICGFR